VEHRPRGSRYLAVPRRRPQEVRKTPDETVVDRGFLASAAPSPGADQLFADDRADFGYVMNLSHAWAHQPAAHDGLMDLLKQTAATAGLSFRQRGVLVSATAGALGDPHCSLAWGNRLAGEVGDEVAAAVLRGDAAALDAADRALASWARTLTRDPNATEAADVQLLRDAGFDDAQIAALTLYVALRIAFSTVNDALGARPDRGLVEAAPPAVRESVYLRTPTGRRDLRLGRRHPGVQAGVLLPERVQRVPQDHADRQALAAHVEASRPHRLEVEAGGGHVLEQPLLEHRHPRGDALLQGQLQRRSVQMQAHVAPPVGLGDGERPDLRVPLAGEHLVCPGERREVPEGGHHVRDGRHEAQNPGRRTVAFGEQPARLAVEVGVLLDDAVLAGRGEALGDEDVMLEGPGGQQVRGCHRQPHLDGRARQSPRLALVGGRHERGDRPAGAAGTAQDAPHGAEDLGAVLPHRAQAGVDEVLDLRLAAAVVLHEKATALAVGLLDPADPGPGPLAGCRGALFGEDDVEPVP
jgi:alkylhydroperoxidase family enzyme